MADEDYPVLDGNGKVIIPAAWQDEGKDLYPVDNAAGQTVVADAWLDAGKPQYPVYNAAGDLIISVEQGRGGKRLWNFEAGDTGPFESFARTGAGTSFTTAGHLVSFASGVPRVTDKGLLLEPAATNLTELSNQFANTSKWNHINVSVVADALDHGLQFFKATATGVETVQQRFYQARRPGLTTGVHTVSIYAKPNSDGYIEGMATPGVGATIGGSSVNTLWHFNPATGLFFDTPPRLTCSAIHVVDDIYRIVISFEITALPAGATFAFQFRSGHSGLVGTAGFFAATQLEVGNKASSWIATGAVAATRGADSATLKVPAGCTTWEAIYGDARTVASGSGLTPGASFDLVTSRPWIGLGNELKNIRFKP